MPTSKKDKITLKIDISKEEYEALKHIAKSKGYMLPSYYLRVLVREIVDGRLQTSTQVQLGVSKEDLEAFARRLQRLITDLLNPYTAKIDEINRRLAEILEMLEQQPAEETLRRPVEQRQPSGYEREYGRGRERRQYYQQRRGYQDRYQEARPRRSTAIDRLREDGVIFEDESQWIRMPERFFQSLEREGAVVLKLSSGMVAVDPSLWKNFKEKLSEIGVRDPEEAATLIESSLGEGAAKLFERLVREGLVVYNEDTRSWEFLEE